jgi:hypothetical protein
MTTKGIVITLIALLLAYPAYLWATYINNTVKSGSAYGFTIGDTKKETYQKLNTSLTEVAGKGEAVFIEIKSNAQLESFLATKSDFNVMVKPLFHDVGFPMFEGENVWNFYVGASYFNTLKLEFCDEQLCKIHRHRKYFELP